MYAIVVPNIYSVEKQGLTIYFRADWYLDCKKVIQIVSKKLTLV